MTVTVPVLVAVVVLVQRRGLEPVPVPVLVLVVVVVVVVVGAAPVTPVTATAATAAVAVPAALAMRLVHEADLADVQVALARVVQGDDPLGPSPEVDRAEVPAPGDDQVTAGREAGHLHVAGARRNSRILRTDSSI